ncbi:hypothetical protein OS493_012869 [Desmophyllum pertusum]|uniref:Uncharacterized protein n=1 Tax=Desmophyllum pertusum TaxID=174260 RepID=A0A9W9Z2T3_9CNID|nr:hypothetical protein OS493_012869 [Desmophyllum pertusum]
MGLNQCSTTRRSQYGYYRGEYCFSAWNPWTSQYGYTPGNIGTAVNTLTARAQQHMRIFNYPKGKNRVAGKGKLPAKKIPTCTLKLFCLGNTGDEKPPSTGAAKTALSNCGLGPGNITFEMNGSSVCYGA